jgi:hypothetical protein
MYRVILWRAQQNTKLVCFFIDGPFFGPTYYYGGGHDIRIAYAIVVSSKGLFGRQHSARPHPPARPRLFESFWEKLAMKTRVSFGRQPFELDGTEYSCNGRALARHSRPIVSDFPHYLLRLSGGVAASWPGIVPWLPHTGGDEYSDLSYRTWNVKISDDKSKSGDSSREE